MLDGSIAYGKLDRIQVVLLYGGSSISDETLFGGTGVISS